MGGKGRRGGCIPGFARGRGSAAFRDPKAEVDPSAVPCGENPAGVFVYMGALYISESVDDRVVRVENAKRIVVAGGNGKGRRPDQFDRPFRIFVNQNGIYVADRNNARVQLWRHGAHTGETVAGGNGPGHGNHQLNQPTGVAVQGDHIYVADRANHRVMRWSHGSSEGVLVAGGNGLGRGSNQLGCPGALCVSGSTLFISDESGARVQRWLVGDRHGITVAGGHGNGSSAGQLYHPLGIALMDQSLLVCDATNHRVQEWEIGSKPARCSARTVCGGFGIGSGPGHLGHCMDCFWDGQQLYVSDWYHACVRTYSKEALDRQADRAVEDQAHTECDGHRYTGYVVEWRDHGGYGFIVDDATGHRYMAHNSDIANSLVRFGYAILTKGEQVEYCLLRDIVGKWKCDQVTAPGGGPVSPEQEAIDISINSGRRQKIARRSNSDIASGLSQVNVLSEVKRAPEPDQKQGQRRRWRPKDNPLMGA